MKYEGEPLEKRADDNVDSLKKRLESYHNQTSPLVSYYAKKGLHAAVDASLESSVVFNSVVAALEKLKNRVSLYIILFEPLFEMKEIKYFNQRYRFLW